MERPRIIVSLTSFPPAIKYAAGAIKSILKGKVLPDRIVLYVTLSQFGEKGIPLEILQLEKENSIFEIRNYDLDIRSYRKLVPAIQDFPNDVIITIDDDIDYNPRMVEQLLYHHRQFPEAIIAHRAKKIKSDKPYRSWKKYRWYHFLRRKYQPSFLNLPTGVGGVLYPPGSLKREMLDDTLFTRLAPTNDDIWFWAAAVANRRKILPVPYGCNKPIGLGKPTNLSLKTVNFKRGVDRNKEALEAILTHYPDIRELIGNE